MSPAVPSALARLALARLALAHLALASLTAGCGGHSAREPGPEPAPRVLRLVHTGPPQVWGGDGGPEVLLDPLELRPRWPTLGPVLTDCLGDPLALPLPGDPGAWRKLVWDDSPRWRLELSGQGGCGLEGALELTLDRDQVGVSGLLVEGRPWTAGGRELAERRLARWRREQAPTLWAQGHPRQRLTLLRALALDPDPDAERALRALAEAHPDAQEGVAEALATRSAGPGATP